MWYAKENFKKLARDKCWSEKEKNNEVEEMHLVGGSFLKETEKQRILLLRFGCIRELCEILDY